VRFVSDFFPAIAGVARRTSKEIAFALRWKDRKEQIIDRWSGPSSRVIGFCHALPVSSKWTLSVSKGKISTNGGTKYISKSQGLGLAS
jgi:hypothetical protein